MLIVKTKIVEVPPVDLSTQGKILNLWINDMQRNGIIILSVKPDNNPGAYLIEYKEEDLVIENNDFPNPDEVILDDSQL